MLKHFTLNIGLICLNGNLNDIKESLLAEFEALGCRSSTPFICSYNSILKEETDDATGKLPSTYGGHPKTVSLTHGSETESSAVDEIPCES
jgi:hypothetical protein